MSITELFNSLVENFKNIKELRETHKILETKFYAISSALVGVTSGAAFGVLITILQSAVSSSESKVLISVFSFVGLLGLLAFDIWLIYPLELDKATTISDKIITALITLIITCAGFLLGIYGALIILVLAVCYFCFKILVPFMFKR